SGSSGRIVSCAGMKTKRNGQRRRVELGRHIVADAEICGGQPTFKGTRIMVWIVLEQLDRGLTWAEIVREWDGRVSEDAMGGAIAIAALVGKLQRTNQRSKLRLPCRVELAARPRPVCRQNPEVPVLFALPPHNAIRNQTRPNPQQYHVRINYNRIGPQSPNQRRKRVRIAR